MKNKKANIVSDCIHQFQECHNNTLGKQLSDPVQALTANLEQFTSVFFKGKKY